jgi:uncharacterized protein (DUF169 family)
MDLALKQSFLTRWQTYFGSADLPITYEYADDDRGAEPVHADEHTHCFIGLLRTVHEDGKSLCFTAKSFHCQGGRYYTGFAQHLRANVAEFLSCDQHGEGERYKKNPQIAAQAIGAVPWIEAPAAHLVFKRWDKLDERDHPQVVIFFATPDVLSGLFTLAGYEVGDPYGSVISPFGSGCSSIIRYPLMESRSSHPRAILGMLDVSARPQVPSGILSFSVPMSKFARMVNDMNESFLITESWRKVLYRIEAQK